MMSSLPRSVTSLFFFSLVQASATPTSLFLFFPESFEVGEGVVKELEADVSFTATEKDMVHIRSVA